MAKLRNIKCIIAYEGTKYQGWQRLKNSGNTIQGKIEQVLARMVGEPIEIIGSGRTDAGVHARYQVCNFHTICQKPAKNIKDYMNKYLPEDIVVTEVQDVDDRFHSRFHAKDKVYKYRLWLGDYPPVFERKYVHVVVDRLNVHEMKDAARLLEGEHDFAGFSTGKTKKSTIRTIHSIDFKMNGNELIMTVTGNGFLYNMVRIIVGTLIDIGKESLGKEAIIQALETGKRSLAGERAPAKGLILHDVRYEVNKR